MLYLLDGKPEYHPTARSKNLYPDVTEDTPGALEIWWLTSSGVSYSKEDGSYGPEEVITRRDVAILFYSLHKVRVKRIQDEKALKAKRKY